LLHWRQSYELHEHLCHDRGIDYWHNF